MKFERHADVERTSLSLRAFCEWNKKGVSEDMLVSEKKKALPVMGSVGEKKINLIFASIKSLRDEKQICKQEEVIALLFG